MGPEQDEPGADEPEPEAERLLESSEPRVAPPPSWSAPSEPPPGAPCDALRTAPPPNGPAHPGPPPPGARPSSGGRARIEAALEADEARSRQAPTFGFQRNYWNRYGPPNRRVLIATVAAVVVFGALYLAATLGQRPSSAAAPSSTEAGRSTVPLHPTRKTTTLGHAVEVRAHVGRLRDAAQKTVAVRVRAVGVQDPAPNPSGSTIPTGFSLVTVKAEACATTHALNPFLAFGNFDVITSGGQHIFVAPKVTLPDELPFTTPDIAPGRCDTDVLPFEVPTSTPVQAIGYLTSAESVRWEVPR